MIRQWALLATVMGCLAALQNANAQVEFKNGTETMKVESMEKKDRTWVDPMKIAEALGYSISVSGEIYFIDFSSYTVAISSRTSIVNTQAKNGGKKKKKKWKASYLEGPIQMSEGRLLVTLESLPSLFNRSFTYHVQKKVLEVEDESGAVKNGYRKAAVKSVFENNKMWIAVPDVANLLNAIVYGSQANRYKLVLPNFTILELRVGSDRVFRNEEVYKILEDPVLVFSGSPYVTLGGIKTIFGVDADWDPKSKMLLLADRYPERRKFSSPQLRRIGYEPEALQFEVEELSAFYQDPAPSFSAEHDQVYESVRDFLTNEPINRQTNTLGKFNLRALANAKGSFLNAPLKARGLFEKTGPNAQLENGSIQWGFPIFQVTGAREYVTLGGLNNQFALLDEITASHSNDHFGENGVNPQFRVKALYGQTFFSIFMSSSLFSQTADVRQEVAGASADLNWAFAGSQKIGASLEQYVFNNRVEQIASEFHEQDFLNDLFGSDVAATVDKTDQTALAQKFISDRHYTTFADLHYQLEKIVQASVTTGFSRYRDPESSDWRSAKDWKLRSILGGQGSRLDASFEHSDPHYRSIGNPFRYEDREILRLAPYLDLAKFWKVYGEYRKEDWKLLGGETPTPVTDTYIYATQSFSFDRNSVRNGITEFDSTLYGKRRTFSLNDTQYFGRDTLDVGASWGKQWFASGLLFSESHTGSSSYQILRSDWKFSVGEELTRRHYPFYQIGRWESTSNLLVQKKAFKARLEYQFKPKTFLEEPVIYTGFLSMGRTIRRNKILNLFVSAASRQSSLANADVWRIGIECVNNFY